MRSALATTVVPPAAAAARGEGTGERLDLLSSTAHYTTSLIAGTLQSSQSEASLVFGASHDGRRFLRRPESDHVFLATSSLDFLNTLVSHWVDNTFAMPRHYTRITWHDAGQTQWELTRATTDEPFTLTGPNKSAQLLPNLSLMAEMAFSGLLIKDILPTTPDQRSAGIDEARYFTLADATGASIRLYPGQKRPVPAQEKQWHENSSGMIRDIASLSQRLIVFTTVPTQRPLLTAPHQIGRLFQADTGVLDRFLLTHDEMLVFERLQAPK